ncbi:uncharacterized protein LOC124889449 [Capsicum annuum]|uniref:uncharacterized protein LOC124889449 n=1 Tax=Capsicum annuum TaxID=4072 RepID=UPI001FB1722C|nr:uncharacterized protein LOC124889449 [Capsicum annuum]
MIMAFSIKAHCDNHNIAEAKAAWYEINWCLQNGYNNSTIESNSTVITDMLKNKKASNFRLNKTIQDTTELLRQATVKLTHCYREANQLADWLAKLVMDSQADYMYFSAQQLPKGVKGPFIMDKIQVPSIGSKVDKTNFFIS